MEDDMKASKVNFQGRGTFLRQHVGKVFLILVILCAGCAPSAQIESMLPVTGGDVKADIVFSPDRIDFGIQTIDTTSATQKVTILNNGADPLVINTLSVTAGFSIVANTCPKALASQGTCTVEIVFKPNLPQDWVGELQLNYGSARVITIQLKGSAQSKNNLFALILSGNY
jgi:hypothetical protein